MTCLKNFTDARIMYSETTAVRTIFRTFERFPSHSATQPCYSLKHAAYAPEGRSVVGGILGAYSSRLSIQCLHVVSA